MAKGVVRAINKGIQDDEPLRVIYSDTEPARTYIWGHPNGNYYVWTDCKWVKMIPPKDKCKDHCCNCCDCKDYLRKDALMPILARFKKDILTSVLRLAQNKCDDKSAILDRLGELEDLVQELQGVDTETNDRLDRLEEHDAIDCVTAEDI